MLAQWCQTCRPILHRGSQLHPTVLNKLNNRLINLTHTSPVIRSHGCDKAVAGRAQCLHNTDDLLEMLVRECTDFPNAPCNHLIFYRLLPFAIQVIVVGYAY